MIDILLVHQLSIPQVNDFLSEIFDCPVERIKIFGLDEFNSLAEDLDVSAWDCVCVSSLVRGDVSQLLQLYRYKSTNYDVIRQVVSVALRGKFDCYIPNDPLDNWIYVHEGNATKYARQVECEEDDYFIFQLI